MLVQRKKKLWLILFLVASVGTAVGLLMYSLSQNINLFMSNLTYYKCYTQMMSRDDARKFREERMTHFGWAVTTFYVRLKGNCFTGPFEEQEFIRILRKYNPNF